MLLSRTKKKASWRDGIITHILSKEAVPSVDAFSEVTLWS